MSEFQHNSQAPHRCVCQLDEGCPWPFWHFESPVPHLYCRFFPPQKSVWPHNKGNTCQESLSVWKSMPDLMAGLLNRLFTLQWEELPHHSLVTAMDDVASKWVCPSKSLFVLWGGIDLCQIRIHRPTKSMASMLITRMSVSTLACMLYMWGNC